MYIISFTILGLAIWLFVKRGSKRWLRNALLLVVMILCVLSALELGVGQITGEGFNDSVFFHLQTGLSGGDITQYNWIIFAGLLFVTTIGLILVRFRHLISPGKEKAISWIQFTIGMLALTAIYSHPASLAAMNYYMRFSNVEVFRDGFYEPQPSVAQGVSPKNLVIIYLESLEQTYFDEKRFPDLINGLRALEQKSVSFSNVTQTVGSDFTIGGMVSSQCGTPLILSGGANSMRVNRFLNGATCLGDILNETGYELSYLGGASLEFAGKGAFYRSHGYNEVAGLDELRPALEDPTYLAEWGLQDDTLLELAQSRLNRLSNSGAPFVLTMLTLDTHHPNGHGETNKKCQNIKYGDGKIPMLNSVKCTDVLVSEFIEDILDGPLAKNTVVAVVSDHLALINGATSLLESGPRRNLFFAIQPGTTPQKIDRAATTMDIGPTLLSMLGVEVPRMGFGVDLLGEHPTLHEKLGLGIDDQGEIDRHLKRYQAVYNYLWDYPNLSNGLYANVERGTVHFGKSEYKIPALFTFDRENEVIQATLGDPRSEESLPESLLEMNEGTRFMWLDDCRSLTTLARSKLVSGEDVCMAYGRRSEAVDVRPIERSTFYSEEELETFLSTKARTDTTFVESQVLLDIGRNKGEIPLRLMYPEPAFNEHGILVHSAGFDAGATFVRRPVNNTLATGHDLPLERGINLVGIQTNGIAKIISRVDQCSTSFQVNNQISWRKLIETGLNEYLAHLVVVHDTAFCGSSIEPLAMTLEGLRLPTLDTLEMRQPYIGVINQQGRVWEFANKSFPKIRVLLDPISGESHPFHRLAEFNDQVASIDANFFNAEIDNTNNVDVVSVYNDALTDAGSELGEAIGKCHKPRPTKIEIPKNSFPINKTLAGINLNNAITFGNGWWSAEAAGRWSGADVAEISVLLPETGSNKLDLVFTVASSAGVAKDLNVIIGSKRLALIRIEDETEIRLDATKLPRNVPVNIKFVTTINNLGCPFSRHVGLDSRQLNFMMKSVHAAITNDISDSAGLDKFSNMVDLPPPNTVPVQPTEIASSPCVQPSDVFWEDQSISVFQLGKEFSISDALNQNLLSFGNGWWDAEQFGRWIGADKADIRLVLPSEPMRLKLILKTASFPKRLGQMALVHDGRLLGIRSTGANRPFEVDVSDLPRSQKITLSIYTSFEEGTCPMKNGIGEDLRELSIMIKSISLSFIDRESLSPTIAHGAGRMDGVAISNSFDALQANLEKFDIFEIDFNWTADEELVCLHDWSESFRSRFDATTNEPIEIHDFRSLLAQSVDLPRNCDLEGLAGWMRANPKKMIVTDVKSDAIRAHDLIASRHPDLLDQFIPQAFHPREIDHYRQLGFSKIIWSLYRFGGSDEDVVTEVSVRRPSAVTMSKSRAESRLLEELRQRYSMEVFVHTINDPREAGCLKARGATGIYSDDLGANSWKSLDPTLRSCLKIASR